MKRVSRPNETIIGIPVIVEPVEIEVPPPAIPVEIRDVTVTIGVLPDLFYKISSMTPSLECSWD